MKIEKAIKVLIKKYEEALKLDYVQKPVAWALYQTWKIADEESERKKKK